MEEYRPSHISSKLMLKANSLVQITSEFCRSSLLKVESSGEKGYQPVFSYINKFKRMPRTRHLFHSHFRNSKDFTSSYFWILLSIIHSIASRDFLPDPSLQMCELELARRRTMNFPSCVKWSRFSFDAHNMRQKRPMIIIGALTKLAIKFSLKH